MHHKFYFTLAGIFLAASLVVPTVAFIILSQQNLANIRYINEPGHVTGPNEAFVNPNQANIDNTNMLILVIVAEVVFVSLFIVMIYLGINHYHGQYDKPQEIS